MPGAIPNVVAISGEVNQTAQAPSTQLNLRQMIGEISQWNPDISPLLIRRWVNNWYRTIIDKREWYGTMIRGQVMVPNVYSTGTVAVTLGSASVVGTGTVWTQAMVGQQFRVGFTTGFQNIQSVADATHLTLDLPWGNPSQSGVGYQILQTWFSFPNIKRIKEMVNQRQGYRLLLNIPQQPLNEYDTWRTTTGWTWMLANKEPTAAGWPQWELYPSPTFQQTFPFLAYIQPNDLVNDTDYPLSFIRSDILVDLCVSDALLFGGPKENRRYDSQTAQIRRKLAFGKLIEAANMDDALYTQDTAWEYGRWPLSQYGALFMQSHASLPGGSSWG